MQDLFKQIIALVVGGVMVGLIMIFAERNVESAPELLILHQKTALPDDLVRAAISGSVKHLDESSDRDGEPLSPQRIEELATSLMEVSGLRFGGSIDTYYIKNESGDEPITFKILSRDFEFAALGGDTSEQYFQNDIDTEIRLLPNESMYFILISNNTVLYSFPDVRIDEQHAFFAVGEKPISPVSLADYSSYDIFPDRLIKDHTLVVAILSFFGIGLICILVFAGIISLFRDTKIAILARISSAKDLAQQQRVIDYVRSNDKKKFSAIESALQDFREKS
ncbi:hypothetical protein SAMN05444002_3129 [Vannielia litorea]|uniref:Uncharacterized protein n=2 Tax=Vannielia litorea TaxID=1217970 RepID=A0A1N6H6X9_9RHOB|nr:hypothetical protein SAMN05444002_3129 [Vannielia litorea]